MGAARVGSAASGQAFKRSQHYSLYRKSEIIGDNITLSVSSGNIGVFDPMEDFAISDIKSGNLDNATKVKLMAAEADDVFYNRTTERLELTQREDLDIKARFADSVININVPQGHAFIGGENSQYGLNINTLAAAGLFV